MLIYFSPSSSYIVLGMILITCWIITRFDRIILKNYEDLNKYENKISESVHDKINHVATIIILRIERIILDAVYKKIDEPYDLYKRNNVINEIKWFVTNMGCTIMVVLVLGVYLWKNIGSQQGAVIVSFFILQRYLTKISELFFRFASMYGDILQRKSRVMNAQILASDFKSENFTNHVLPERWQQIQIRNLNFSYHAENGAHRHLNSIQMSIKRGERIALIGESGSAKTTFLKVFRDLYHPQSLDLTVDGVVIPDGFGGISRAIALIPQDQEIFATTIGENITLGAEYSAETIRRYTDMACITADIEALPKKFASLVNEKGVNLSSGQRQRLALARGLLACENKSIVLLDEPTSSVDVTNEMQIYRNIFKGFPDKAVLSSIHRPHLFPYFGQIYLFEKGKIIASGTFDELLASSPEFQEIWKHHREHGEEM